MKRILLSIVAVLLAAGQVFAQEMLHTPEGESHQVRLDLRKPYPDTGTLTLKIYFPYMEEWIEKHKDRLPIPNLTGLEIISGQAVTMNGKSEHHTRHLEHFPALRSLALQHEEVDDVDLTNIARLKSLEELHLGELVGAPGLDTLKSLSKLRRLTVAPWRPHLEPEDKIFDPDLRLDGLRTLTQVTHLDVRGPFEYPMDPVFAMEQLVHLEIGDFQKEVPHFDRLDQLRNLESLAIYSPTTLNSSHLAQLQSLPRLTNLRIHIGGGGTLSPDAIFLIARLKHLQRLDLNLDRDEQVHLAPILKPNRLTLFRLAGGYFDSATLQALKQSSNLRTLSLYACRSAPGFPEALRALTDLEELNLTLRDADDHLKSECRNAIVTLVNLRRLSSTFSDDSHVEPIGSLQALEEISFYRRSWLTRQGLKSLTALKSLRYIDIGSGRSDHHAPMQVSGGDVADLLPGVTIVDYWESPWHGGAWTVGRRW
jgi:hypothetical protein